MERLCQTYWYPLYVFVRRKGYSHEEASDLTQAYFAKFLELSGISIIASALYWGIAFHSMSMEVKLFSVGSIVFASIASP